MQEMEETWVWSLSQEDPLEKEMATYSSILAGKSHGQKGLVGYSPWGPQESDQISDWACLHTLGHYSDIKMNDLLIYTASWMNPKNILNKRSQTQKSTYCMTAFIWASVEVKTNIEWRKVDGWWPEGSGGGDSPSSIGSFPRVMEIFYIWIEMLLA